MNPFFYLKPLQQEEGEVLTPEIIPLTTHNVGNLLYIDQQAVRDLATNGSFYWFNPGSQRIESRFPIVKTIAELPAIADGGNVIVAQGTNGGRDGAIYTRDAGAGSGDYPAPNGGYFNLTETLQKAIDPGNSNHSPPYIPFLFGKAQTFEGINMLFVPVLNDFAIEWSSPDVELWAGSNVTDVAYVCDIPINSGQINEIYIDSARVYNITTGSQVSATGFGSITPAYIQIKSKQPAGILSRNYMPISVAFYGRPTDGSDFDPYDIFPATPTTPVQDKDLQYFIGGNVTRYDVFDWNTVRDDLFPGLGTFMRGFGHDVFYWTSLKFRMYRDGNDEIVDQNAYDIAQGYKYPDPDRKFYLSTFYNGFRFEDSLTNVYLPANKILSPVLFKGLSHIGAGQKGTTVFNETWTTGEYNNGDIVHLSGVWYEATGTTSTTPPGAGWQLANDWQASPSNDYVIFDRIHYQGQRYILNTYSTGTDAPNVNSDWQVWQIPAGWAHPRVNWTRIKTSSPTLNGTSPSHFIDAADLFYQIVAFLGSNASANIRDVYGASAGNNYSNRINIDNENRRYWFDVSNQSFYTPYITACFLSAIIDGHGGTMGSDVGIWNADPDFNIDLDDAPNPFTYHEWASYQWFLYIRSSFPEQQRDLYKYGAAYYGGTGKLTFCYNTYPQAEGDQTASGGTDTIENIPARFFIPEDNFFKKNMWPGMENRLYEGTYDKTHDQEYAQDHTPGKSYKVNTLVYATNGQVYKSNASTSAPAFQTPPPSADWTLYDATPTTRFYTTDGGTSKVASKWYLGMPHIGPYEETTKWRFYTPYAQCLLQMRYIMTFYYHGVDHYSHFLYRDEGNYGGAAFTATFASPGMVRRNNIIEHVGFYVYAMIQRAADFVYKSHNTGTGVTRVILEKPDQTQRLIIAWKETYLGDGSTVSYDIPIEGSVASQLLPHGFTSSMAEDQAVWVATDNVTPAVKDPDTGAWEPGARMTQPSDKSGTLVNVPVAGGLITQDIGEMPSMFLDNVSSGSGSGVLSIVDDTSGSELTEDVSVFTYNGGAPLQVNLLYLHGDSISNLSAAKGQGPNQGALEGSAPNGNRGTILAWCIANNVHLKVITPFMGSGNTPSTGISYIDVDRYKDYAAAQGTPSGVFASGYSGGGIALAKHLNRVGLGTVTKFDKYLFCAAGLFDYDAGYNYDNSQMGVWHGTNDTNVSYAGNSARWPAYEADAGGTMEGFFKVEYDGNGHGIDGATFRGTRFFQFLTTLASNMTDYYGNSPD